MNMITHSGQFFVKKLQNFSINVEEKFDNNTLLKISLLFLLTTSVASASPVNLGFETGNLNGWVATTGVTVVPGPVVHENINDFPPTPPVSYYPFRSTYMAQLNNLATDPVQPGYVGSIALNGSGGLNEFFFGAGSDDTLQNAAAAQGKAFDFIGITVWDNNNNPTEIPYFGSGVGIKQTFTYAAGYPLNYLKERILFANGDSFTDDKIAVILQDANNNVLSLNFYDATDPVGSAWYTIPTDLMSTPGQYTIGFALIDGGNQNLYLHTGSSLLFVDAFVPEPSSLLLLMSGLFGVIGFRHHRKSQTLSV